MSSTSDMNIVLGQGNAIKEVHNLKKQNLELNQQIVAQETEEKKKEEKSKVQEFENSYRVELKDDKEKKNKEGPKDNKKGSNKEGPEEESDLSDERFIDIKV